MKIYSRSLYLIIFLLVSLILSGCTLSAGDSAATETKIAANIFKTLTVSGSNSIETPTTGQQPGETLAPPTQTPSGPAPTVAHTTFPTSPGLISSWVSDPSSDSTGTSSDEFSRLFFERPFTADPMVYQGHLDITRAEISSGSPFTYVNIFLNDTPPAGSSAHYGIEIDLDKDGRGDWLIYGQVPPSSDWTSEGVRVYQDTNNDVGGPNPIQSDVNPAGLNGYDSLVFDQGYGGADPDAAWVRRDPANPNQVQLAFKESLIGSPSSYLWGAWADEGAVEPSWFDYNDHFTFAEAGSPDPNSSEYPIKKLYLLDNTCRWGYGFIPTNADPGICSLPPTPTPTTPPPTPTATPKPGTISGGVWKDLNGNGVINGGEPGFSGVTVRLGQGSCMTTGYKTANTAVNGSYSFTNIPPGTYCISVNIVVTCGGWLATTATQHTVNLAPGENKFVSWIGYANYICY